MAFIVSNKFSMIEDQNQDVLEEFGGV